jgi:hypothetical protein
MVHNTVKFVDAKKTLDEAGMILTAEAIVRENPTLTLEEILLTCQGMCLGKFGKFYERLKAQEFLECLNQTEANRADFLEQMHRHKDITRGVTDVSQIKHTPQSMNDLLRKRWFDKFERTTTGKPKDDEQS